MHHTGKSDDIVALLVLTGPGVREVEDVMRVTLNPLDVVCILGVTSDESIASC